MREPHVTRIMRLWAFEWGDALVSLCAVHIVDDDDAVRSSLASLLGARPDLMAKTYRSGEIFLDSADATEPGIVLLDMHMAGMSGMAVLNELGRFDAKFGVVVLTGQGNVGLAVDAMKAGAFDFLEKPHDPTKLMDVIGRASARWAAESSAAARSKSARAKIGSLSGRERDVLNSLIAGHSNKAMAYELDISPRTVEIHRARLMEKLEVRSLSEVLQIAFAAGMLPPDEGELTLAV